MYLISDAPPDEVDVQKYVGTQKNHRMDVLSKRYANKLRRLQDNLVNNYTYTTEDIEKNLERRKKQGKAAGNLGLVQTKIAIAVQAAHEAVSDAERKVADAKRALMESDSNANEADLTRNVREAEKVLEQAKKNLEVILEEERGTKEAVQDRKRKLTQRSKDKHWAKVNERNVQANQRADREANKGKEDTNVGSSKKKEFNPYARRRVKPKILWEVGQAKDEEAEEKTSQEQDTENLAAGVTTKSAADGSTASIVLESQEKVTALRDRHQFAIDEESLAQSTAIDRLLGGGKKKAPNKNRIRRGISLEEYLDRKAKGAL